MPSQIDLYYKLDEEGQALIDELSEREQFLSPPNFGEPYVTIAGLRFTISYDVGEVGETPQIVLTHKTTNMISPEKLAEVLTPLSLNNPTGRPNGRTISQGVTDGSLQEAPRMIDAKYVYAGHDYQKWNIADEGS